MQQERAAYLADQLARVPVDPPCGLGLPYGGTSTPSACQALSASAVT